MSTPQELQTAVKELRKENARIKTLLDHASDLIVITNAQSVIIYANDSVMDKLGYKPEEVVGQQADIFAYNPEGEEMMFDEEQPLPPGLMEDGIWTGELPLRHKDGHPVVVSQTLVMLKDEDGNPEGLAVIANDVTEYKESEAKINRLTAILENTTDLVILTNEYWEITYANPSVMELLGYEPEEVVGETAQIFAYAPPGEKPVVNEEQPLPPGLEDSGVWVGEIPLRRKDGSPLMVSEVLVLLKDDKGNIEGFGVIARDITAERAAEAEREQMQMEIIETQRRALAELSTPTVPVINGVVVMPLSGTIDTRRGQQIMETLLQAIVAQQAEVAIIDITGVPVVDTGVANHLLQVGLAANMLGAEFVLVGISSEVAQTIVRLGVDLSGVTTRANLQSGIEYALRRLGKQIVSLRESDGNK